MELTENDLAILDLVREKGKVPHREIASTLGIPVGTAFNRLKMMEREGYIYHYSARVNYAKLGWNTVGWLLIALDSDKLRKLKITEQKAADMIANDCPFITHISTIAAKSDIIARYHCKDIDHLNEQISKLRQLPFIERTETMVSLHNVDKPQLISAISTKNIQTKFKSFESLK